MCPTLPFAPISGDVKGILHNRMLKNNFCFLIYYFFTILYIHFYATTCDPVFLLSDTS